MLAPNYIVTEEFQQIYLWTLGTILNIQSTHDLVSKSSVSFTSQTYQILYTLNFNSYNKNVKKYSTNIRKNTDRKKRNT